MMRVNTSAYSEIVNRIVNACMQYVISSQKKGIRQYICCNITDKLEYSGHINIKK